jgi:hypothetical protein
MQVHAVLVDRLTAALGRPATAEGQKRSWRVDAGASTVNVILDLPAEPLKTRVWVFDPRQETDESVMQFAVDNPSEVDLVVAKVLERLIR